MSPEKTVKVVFTVFLLIGLVFFIIGAGMFASFQSFKSGALETQATVLHAGSGGGGTTFSYRIGGAEYIGRSSSYNSAWYPGRVVTIYVDASDYENFRTDIAQLLGLIFGGMGFVFLLVGIIPLIVMSAKKNAGKKLMAAGRRVTAEISDVITGNVYVGGNRHTGRPCYHIICDWFGPGGKTYRFKSGALWTNPAAEIERRGVTNLPVYIDGDNVKKYHVDTRFLTENVVDLT